MQFKRSVWTGEKESQAPSPPPAATMLSGEALASEGGEGQLPSEAELRDAEEKREEEEEEAAAAAVSEEEETEDVAMGRPQWQLQAAAEGVA